MGVFSSISSHISLSSLVRGSLQFTSCQKKISLKRKGIRQRELSICVWHFSLHSPRSPDSHLVEVEAAGQERQRPFYAWVPLLLAVAPRFEWTLLIEGSFLATHRSRQDPKVLKTKINSENLYLNLFPHICKFMIDMNSVRAVFWLSIVDDIRHQIKDLLSIVL